MILPGMTISPPNFLTPRRLPRLSRPLRDEPPAFLCAICYPFRRLHAARTFDFHDTQDSLVLAMTLLAPVIVPAFLFEDDDLGRTGLLDHGGADRSSLDQRSAGGNLSPFADHQHFAELDGGAGLGDELFDRNDIVLGDPVLLAARPDHCEHDTRRYNLRYTACNRLGRTDTPEGVPSG